MDGIKRYDLEALHQVQNFKGKPIINITNGEQIGVVDDILIHLETTSVAAIVIIKGNLLRQDLYAIQAQDIRVWGKDSVLVSGMDLLQKKSQVPELSGALSASEVMRGREIISLDGERSGELRDFLINQDGVLEGIEAGRISEHLANQIGAKNRGGTIRLPTSAIHSMGKDVIIIDMTKIEKDEDVEGPVMEFPVEDQPSEAPQSE